MVVTLREARAATGEAAGSDTFRGLAACLGLPGEISLRMVLKRAVIFRFAPLVRLHPDEEFLPTSVDWILPRVCMRLDVENWWDKDVLPRGQVVAESIAIQHRDGHSSGGSKPSRFYLQIPNDDEEDTVRRGDYAKATVYAHVIDGPPFDIQYWFFYARNGDFVPGPASSAHEGDWEHCTVRLSSTGTPTDVYFAAHDGEGKWHRASEVSWTDARPIVYSAYASHASYPAAGEQVRSFNVPNDHTADGGRSWETWRRLVVLDQEENGSELWLAYSGRWGEVGGNTILDKNLPILNDLAQSGPRGPAFQDSWSGDPTG